MESVVRFEKSCDLKLKAGNVSVLPAALNATGVAVRVGLTNYGQAGPCGAIQKGLARRSSVTKRVLRSERWKANERVGYQELTMAGIAMRCLQESEWWCL